MADQLDILSSRDGRHNGGSKELTPGSGFQSLVMPIGSDAAPQLVTLTWSATFLPLPAPIANGQFRLVGKMTWGVSAIVHTAQFDVGRCGSITMAASSVHFYAANESARPGPTIVVNASLAYGTRPGGMASAVELTEYFENANSAGVLIPVPNFAKTVIVKPSTDAVFATGDLRLELCGLNGAAIHTHLPQASTLAAACPLTNEIVFVRVRYTDLAPLSGSLLFGLAL